MKIVRISSLLIGLSMIFQWLFFLITGNVPELEITPVSIAFHITIELVTAIMLIATFFMLRHPKRWKLFFAVYTQGMLGYTVVNSAGYFAQSGDWGFLLMFGLLLCASMLNTVLIIKTT